MPAETRIKKPPASEQIRQLLSGKTKLLLKQQWGLAGSFRTDNKNRLIYSFKPDSPTQKPSEVTLEGGWRLKSDKELQFIVKGSRDNGPKTLSFRGNLADAGANQLAFVFSEEGKSQSLSLSGRWAADERNRLSFIVKKANGVEDKLTLQGTWEIGPHHELRYQTVAGKHRRQESFLIFDGAWQFNGSRKLIYKLSGSSQSVFAFQASLSGSLVMADKGELSYDVGLGLFSGKTHRKRITLFGSWKLNRDFSVSFEVPYADGRIEAMRFEGIVSPSPKDRIAVALSAASSRKLGLTVVFTRDFFRNAQLFLRLKRDAEESSIIGGVQVRF